MLPNMSPLYWIIKLLKKFTKKVQDAIENLNLPTTEEEFFLAALSPKTFASNLEELSVFSNIYLEPDFYTYLGICVDKLPSSFNIFYNESGKGGVSCVIILNGVYLASVSPAIKSHSGFFSNASQYSYISKL